MPDIARIQGELKAAGVDGWLLYDFHNRDAIAYHVVDHFLGAPQTDWIEGYVANDEGLVACRIYKTVPARRMWDVIMSSTYDFAEPGFVLIDRMNEMNNNWWCENIRATNPCGEQPLPPYGACLLGSINLAKLVKNPFEDDAQLDVAELERLTRF